MMMMMMMMMMSWRAGARSSAPPPVQRRRRCSTAPLTGRSNGAIHIVQQRVEAFIWQADGPAPRPCGAGPSLPPAGWLAEPGAPLLD
jgi:hypothetical protein